MQLHADLVFEKRIELFTAAKGGQCCCRVQQEVAKGGKGVCGVKCPGELHTKTACLPFLPRKGQRVAAGKITDSPGLSSGKKIRQGPEKGAVSIIAKKKLTGLGLADQFFNLFAALAEPFPCPPG